MLVGEQPGDKEDIAGKPFVGPAGRVLDQALQDAGIEREETFVTNAVKHFKHEMRGKRRLHKRPNNYEIERCKIWLDLERNLVKPSTIIALGVTAARSLTGNDRHHRQNARQADRHGGRHAAHRHRASFGAVAHRGRGERHAAYRSFVADLKAAAATSRSQKRAPDRADISRLAASRPVAARPASRRLGQRRRDLLHAVDEIDRRGRRQHQAAGRVAAAGDRRIGLTSSKPRDGEFDAQRLAVEDRGR